MPLIDDSANMAEATTPTTPAKDVEPTDGNNVNVNDVSDNDSKFMIAGDKKKERRDRSRKASVPSTDRKPTTPRSGGAHASTAKL